MFAKYIIISLKPKFWKTKQIIDNPTSILDIGIANKSYTEAKTIYPNSKYTGIDYTPIDFKMLDGDIFHQLDLEKETINLLLQSNKYDLILINHVLEHLTNGEKIYNYLCTRVAPGGLLYAEFPSIRTLNKRKNFFRYHFHDDKTHKRVYQLETLANAAMSNGLKVVSCGAASTFLKDFLSIPRALLMLIRGKSPGAHLLFLERKIDFILVQNPK